MIKHHLSPPITIPARTDVGFPATSPSPTSPLSSSPRLTLHAQPVIACSVSSRDEYENLSSSSSSHDHSCVRPAPHAGLHSMLSPFSPSSAVDPRWSSSAMQGVDLSHSPSTHCHSRSHSNSRLPHVTRPLLEAAATRFDLFHTNEKDAPSLPVSNPCRAFALILLSLLLTAALTTVIIDQTPVRNFLLAPHPSAIELHSPSPSTATVNVACPMSQSQQSDRHLDSERQRELCLSSQPFYCRGNGWILGNWSDDGHTYFPRAIRNPYNGSETQLRVEDKYHIYTTDEARKCLRHKQFFLLGPSYMRDLMTALIDLLHGYPKDRRYEKIAPPPLNVSVVGSGFEGVQFVHVNGFMRRWNTVAKWVPKMANATVIADELIWDVGFDIVSKVFLNHTFMARDTYFSNLRRFLNLCKQYDVNVIWMTQMSLEHRTGTDAVPTKYKPFQTDDLFRSLLVRTFPILEEYHVPWIDVFHMTGSCVTDPAETDKRQTCNPSGHSHFYVSRMKLQMALNYYCNSCRPC